MRYLLGSQEFDGRDPGLEGGLAAAHAAKERPLCLCSPLRPPLYIARLDGNFVLKRMPFTGAQHDADCDHYDPPPELSGAGQVIGSAVKESEDGTTAISLDFALAKGPARKPPAGGGEPSETVRADGTKLTMRALLHFLWDESQLTRWSPKMQGKRWWGVVRRELLKACAGKVTKGVALADVLYVPHPWSQEHAREVNEMHRSALSAMLARQGSRCMVIAPLRVVEQARFGYKAWLKHMPELPIQLTDDVYRQITKTMANQIQISAAVDDTELIALAVISKGVAGLFELESLCLMNVSPQWLPFDTMNERTLLSDLVAGERRFTKALRYNLSKSKPLAFAVLKDTEAPVALYVDEFDDDEKRTALNELVAESQMASWIWHIDEPLPALPVPVVGASQP